jgi:hypothetical protein
MNAKIAEANAKVYSLAMAVVDPMIVPFDECWSVSWRLYGESVEEDYSFRCRNAFQTPSIRSGI